MNFEEFRNKVLWQETFREKMMSPANPLSPTTRSRWSIEDFFEEYLSEDIEVKLKSKWIEHAFTSHWDSMKDCLNEKEYK